MTDAVRSGKATAWGTSEWYVSFLTVSMALWFIYMFRVQECPANHRGRLDSQDIRLGTSSI